MLTLPPGLMEAHFMRSGVDVARTAVACGLSVMGSWVELIASTSAPIDAFCLWHGNTSSSGAYINYNAEIGVGAAASEVVVVPTFQVGQLQDNVGVGRSPFWFPVPRIPAGSRIAARGACTNFGATVDLGLDGFRAGPEGSPYPRGGIEQITSVSSCLGPAVTPGVSNAFGTIVQIHSSTPSRYAALIWGIANSNSAAAARNYVMRIYAGAASSEVKIADVAFVQSTAERVDYDSDRLILLGRPIPKGTRISVAIATSSGTAPDTLYPIILGVRG